MAKLDSDWIRRSFLVKKDELDPKSDDFKRRFFTTLVYDYTDTKPGGSLCINPPPARTRHADIRVKSAVTGLLGKGRFYKEAIDDNAQIIHMRFGVEQHNSLTSFFTGFYNSAASQVARTGRTNNEFFYGLGKVAGFVVQLASWKLLAVHFLGAAVNFLSKTPHSKFYYLKPTMALYWNAVTTMVNHLAVNRGIVPRVFGDEVTNALDPNYTGAAAGPIMHQIMPTIFNKRGSVDVYALANRAKRLERQRYLIMRDKLDKAREMGITDMQKVVREILNTPLPSASNSEPSLEAYLQRWFTVSTPKSEAQEGGSTSESLEDTFGSGTDKKEGYLDSLIKFGTAEEDDGSQFASFRVNATGPIQNSFSNTVGESNLQSRINGMSADMRSKRFDFAGGNLVGGAIGAAFGAVKDAVSSFATGVLDSVQMSGLATLAGSAFVDMPKYWQSSMANLPTMSYTINLVAPYHNPVSQLINIDIPLCMLLAGVLPKSTGTQTYTGPFILELFDRGRCQTRLGMIDSMSITRGTGNVGFNQDGKALGVDVTFTVVDMSSILHMPIAENFSFTQAAIQSVGQAIGGDAGEAAAITMTGGAFSPDTVFSDYMAVLSGMSLPDQVHGFRHMKLNLTRRMAAFETWKSPAHMASFFGDTLPGRAMSMFYRGTDKQ